MQKQMKLWKQFWAHGTFENVINKLWNQGDKNQMPRGGGTAVPPVQPLSLSNREPSFHSAGPGSRGYGANACLLLHTGSQGGSIWKTQNERTLQHVTLDLLKIERIIHGNQPPGRRPGRQRGALQRILEKCVHSPGFFLLIPHVCERVRITEPIFRASTIINLKLFSGGKYLL